MKKAIALLLVLMFALSLLAGCGGEEGSLSGKYYCYSEEFETFEDDWYMEFKSGGKFTYSVIGDSYEGTYKVSGDTLTYNLLGSTETGTIDGDKIITGEGDSRIVWVKK